VAGDVLELTMRRCTANPCSPGASTEYGWSVYRDTLTLAAPPRPPVLAEARREARPASPLSHAASR
jgi:hypothetical protein